MKTLFRRTSLALALTTTLVMTAQAQDLRISMYADITGLDPHDTSDNVSYSVQSGIFERLFQFDPQMKLEPWLATGYTSNDSATEFTLTLRKGVTFQDGTPFDAEAVKANLDRLADQKKGLKRNSLYKMIDKVTVLAPDQVKISLNPKVDQVIFSPSPEDATRVAALKSGQVDAIWPLPSDLIAAVKQDSNLAIQRDPSIYLYYMAINTQHKPLADVRVRQAINYAIDRNLWLKVAFAGLGKPATSAMPEGVQFYEKQSDPDYHYAPDKAKALLKAAGYPNGLDLKLWVTNATASVRAAQVLKAQLATVGIRATVTPMDSGTRNAKLWGVQDPKKAEFDLYYGGWSTSTGDADWALRPLFATESWVPTSYNVSYFSNPDVDKAIAAGLATADPAKRGIAYAQAQKLLWKEAPVAFLGTPDNLVGKRSTLNGVSMLPDGNLLFTQASFK